MTGCSRLKWWGNLLPIVRAHSYKSYRGAPKHAELFLRRHCHTQAKLTFSNTGSAFLPLLLPPLRPPLELGGILLRLVVLLLSVCCRDGNDGLPIVNLHVFPSGKLHPC